MENNWKQFNAKRIFAGQFVHPFCSYMEKNVGLWLRLEWVMESVSASGMAVAVPASRFGYVHCDLSPWAATVFPQWQSL